MVASLFGCAGGGGDSKQVAVGSKEFTEQLILGQIAIKALEEHGFTVIDRTGLAGTKPARVALENGEIDLYWEYTGTAWLVALGHDQPITDSEEAYNKVKEEDAANGLIWLPYAPFDNTYTLMMRQEDAQALGIVSLSDLAAYMAANPAELMVGIDHEFSARPDGWPELIKVYGIDIPEENVSIMDLGITYKALRDGQVDVAMGFATDGRIAAFDLVNLEDDKHFFPVYNPSPVVRTETLEKYPEIADILGDIGPSLDTETMTNLNYQVDIEEREPEEVAEEWLRDKGFIE